MVYVTSEATRKQVHDALASPDMTALLITIGNARYLLGRKATPDDWQALTDALLAEHTPTQLANMLTGAAAIIARTGPVL